MAIVKVIFKNNKKDWTIMIKKADVILAIILVVLGISASVFSVMNVSDGQAVVIYEGEVCLGGAIIDKVYYNEERRKY